MKRLMMVMSTSVALAGLSGCSGKRAFTRGTYQDPNEIRMLNDKFNENDLQLIAKKLVDALAQSKAFARIQGQPIIVIGRFKNSTSEHIDLKSLADKLQVALMPYEKFRFQAKEVREEVAQEYEYQGSGYVKPGEAKGPGQQESGDYLMTGEISSIIQEVGADKAVYYKFTGKLTNLRTGVLEWAAEKELVKQFEKQGVSW